MKKLIIHDLDPKSRFKFLFDESYAVGRSVEGIQSNERLSYLAGVFTRQILHSYTLWNICNPISRNELLENKGIFYDFASGYVVSRSMYEAVLISNFILLNKSFDHSRNVVLKVARLHALIERKILSGNMKSRKPEAKEAQILIPKLRKEILEHEEYIKLPVNVKKFVETECDKNRNWHNKSMPKLAKLAGFHPSWHTQYYGYLSNYAHVGPLSVEQMSATDKAEDARMFTEIIYDFAENFLSRSLDILAKVCESEGINIKLSPDSLELIESWKESNSEDIAHHVT